MNQATKKLFAVLVFTLGTMSVGAQAKHVRIRLFAAMDPIGQLTGMGMGPSSGDLRASSGYGFAPGVEAFWLFGQMVEAGVGFQWQIPRQVYRSNGGSGEFFNFVPLYGVVRIKLDTLKSFKLFLTAKVGYTFFIDSPGFQNILSIDSGGPLVSSGGGLYAAWGFGGNLHP